MTFAIAMVTFFLDGNVLVLVTVITTAFVFLITVGAVTFDKVCQKPEAISTPQVEGS